MANPYIILLNEIFQSVARTESFALLFPNYAKRTCVSSLNACDSRSLKIKDFRNKEASCGIPPKKYSRLALDSINTKNRAIDDWVGLIRDTIDIF